MNFLDNLFLTQSMTDTDDGFEALVRCNPEHPVYKAHFPGNPITPGVCQLGIVEELMSSQKGLPLRVSHIKNIKYMNIISPTDNATFDVELSRIQQVDNGYSVQCLLKGDQTAFTKMSLILSSKQ